jgi:uncharacterized protein HemX
MSKQSTRRRRVPVVAARAVVVGVAVAALVGIVGAGQGLAGTDERVLERQGMIDRQKAAAASQADEQGKAAEHSRQKATEVPRRFFRPEPSMDTGPRLDADQQLPPAPAPPVRAHSRTGLAVTLAVVALLLAVGAATTWRIRRRHPQPESTV